MPSETELQRGARGTATEGCTIYVEIMPCMDCARAIVQAGIIQVVVSSERMTQYSSAYYDEHFGMTEVLLKKPGSRFGGCGALDGGSGRRV
jgi:dCMP deaminase